MAKRFLTPLNLTNLASDPASGTEGDLYYNTTYDVIKIYINGEWTDLSASVEGQLFNIDSIEYPDYITLDTNPSLTSASVGTIAWDSGEEGLSVQVNNNVNLTLGKEIYVLAYNAEGTALNPGEVVMVNGAQGQRPQVIRAYNTSDSTSARTFGMVAETIASGAEGIVITQGVIGNIDTDDYNTGDILYLSASPGLVTTVKPQAPNHYVWVGVVLSKNQSSGRIYIKPQNGYELDEIHDVRITSIAEGDIIIWNSASSLWLNEPIQGYLNTASAAAYASASAYTNSASSSLVSYINTELENKLDTQTYASASANFATLNGEETLTNKTLTSPTITDGVFEDTFTIGSQVFYEHGVRGFSVNEDFDITGGTQNFTGYHYTSGAGRDGVAFTLARTGQFTNGFGITGSSSNNQFVVGGEAANTDIVFKRSIGMPFNVSNGTEIFRMFKDGTYKSQTLSSAPTSPTTGTIAIADGVNWDPLNKQISRPYIVFYTGSAWITLEEDEQSIINSASAAAVSFLVDSAPGALDTLNELAAALGDDENFASTIINTISSASANSISSANSYTDGEITTLIGVIASASAQAITDANDYTDSEIATAIVTASAAAAGYTDNEISSLTTTDIEEGSNLYYTDIRSLNTASTALVHDNHNNITSTYDQENSQIILSASVGNSDAVVNTDLSQPSAIGNNGLLHFNPNNFTLNISYGGTWLQLASVTQPIGSGDSSTSEFDSSFNGGDSSSTYDSYLLGGDSSSF